MSRWMVTDALLGETYTFDTEDEAVEMAKDILSEHRDEANSNGEWPDEMGQLTVYEAKYRATIVERGENEETGETWVEYGITKIEGTNDTKKDD